MRIRRCSHVESRFVVYHLCLSSFLILASRQAEAQDPTTTTIELVHGYITATSLPEGFDVGDDHVLLQPLTGFMHRGGKVGEFDYSLRRELRPGAYVWVLGKTKKKQRQADVVEFRDDRTQQISGLGPVNSVREAGQE